jgi:hypothetical protein
MKLPRYVPQREPDAKMGVCFIWFQEDFIWNHDCDEAYYIKRKSGSWQAARIHRNGADQIELRMPSYNNVSSEFPIEKYYQEWLFTKAIEDSVCQRNTQEI